MSTFPKTFDGSQMAAHSVTAGYSSEDLDPDDFTCGYGIWSGTSFAAAIASARAASMLPAPALNINTDPGDGDPAVAVPRARELVNPVTYAGWLQ